MRLSRYLLALFVVVCFSGLEASAMNFQPKPYDATYEMSFGGETYHQRRISDGHGRERSELNTPNGKMINIRDEKNNVSYTVIPNRKTALKRTLAQSNPNKDKNFVVTSPESAKEIGATPLGRKTINGHPCQGFRYNHRGNVSTAWIGEDIGTLVLMEGNGPDGKMSLRLTSVKPFDGKSNWFSPPADCKVVQMPSFGMFNRAGMQNMMKRRASVGPQSQPVNPASAQTQNPYAALMQQGGVANGMPQGLSSFSKGGMTPEKMQQLKDFANTMKQRFGNVNQGSTY